MKPCLWVTLVAALVAGCVTANPGARPVPPPVHTETQVGLYPSTPEELGQGVVQAHAQGDSNRAMSYYLSDEDFAALFSWEPASDPRPTLMRERSASVQRLTGALKGARFVNVTELKPSSVRTIKQGQTVAGLTFKHDTPAYDYMELLIEVGGVQKLLRLEGLVHVNGYWRLFSPTYRLR